jgi:hypothetical protein
MAKAKQKAEPQLKVIGVFGNDPAHALIAARAPDSEEEDDEWTEDDEDDEDSGPGERLSLLLELDGSGTRLKQRVPHSLEHGWQSPHGPIYFAAEGGQVLVYDSGRFKSEKVTEPEEELGRVIGHAGGSAAKDTVVALAEARAFVRVSGRWNEIELPEETEMVWATAILRPNAMYILADTGLLLFDGKKVDTLEGPDEELTGICVRPNGDLIATSDAGLYVWSEAESCWTLHESPAELTIGMLDRGDEVLLATDSGILSWDGAKFHKLAKGFDSNGLAEAGGVAFALGAESGLWMNQGNAWNRISVPASLLEADRV